MRVETSVLSASLRRSTLLLSSHPSIAQRCATGMLWDLAVGRES